MRAFLILLAFLGVFAAFASAAPPLGEGQGTCNSGTGNAPFPGNPVPSCSATPGPTSLASVAPIYNYAASTSIGGGYTGFDKTAAQDLFVGLETNGDNGTIETNMKANCPSGGNCRTYVYFSAPQVACNNTNQRDFYAAIYASPGPGDEAFSHDTTTATPGPGSRVKNQPKQNEQCNTSGGFTTANSTTAYMYYPYLAASETWGWVKNNLFTSGGETGFPNGDTWNCVRYDNFSFKPIQPAREYGNQTGGNGQISTGYGIPLWRSSQGTFLGGIGNSGCQAINSEGPGNANYSSNNNGASSTQSGVGVINWAVDDEDLCDSLGTQGRSSLKLMMFEKVITNSSTQGGVNSLYIFPHNLKIAINTSSRHFADANCNNIPLGITGYMGKSGSATAAGTTSWMARSYGTVMRGLMEPTAHTGAFGGPDIWLAIRFSADIQGASRQPIFPEDGLVFGPPEQALAKWCWGGNAPTCNGNGQSSLTDANGNGCYGSSGDTGGVNSVSTCPGGLGSDPDGGTTPLYWRTFSPCNYWGVQVTWCGVGINMSTSTDTTLAAVGWGGHTPGHELLPAGGEIYDDPLNSGHPVCSSATICTGVATPLSGNETSVTTSTNWPHCVVWTNTGTKQATWDAMNTSNRCAIIVLP